MKTIAITGGSSGIGYATAKQLLQAGHRVLILSRNASECDLRSHPECQVYPLDLSDLKTLEGLPDFVRTHAGSLLDALVNCAGVGFGTPLPALTEADYDRVMDTNVKGLFFTTKTLLPLMGKGSVICNISSIAGVRGFTEWTTYCASKFAVEGFSKALREEVRSRGIKVMVVRPGAVDTPLYHFLPADEKKDFMHADTIAMTIASQLFLEPNACVEEILINNAAGDL